ncbi:hypothetical protein EIN_408930 [Entamoeba invadens IP1]|uniref:Uncharacterized protein n=1 Tax=Entamoeba invadens IP1 TaxID=370355 RepID=A0A0A1TWL8_ENTIV|nr:hypothetical protein EIN_408930 [Entamoeba invadens IP1]ELP85614.1 hypothetical protein EIN_408930 [Entamoeba invadens IP1]|eukprot:XP_004184960.1 hypothetical protein EIN_408930 [Entamoeba invadens IP1]
MAKPETQVIFAFNDSNATKDNELFWQKTNELYQRFVTSFGVDHVFLVSFGTGSEEITPSQFNAMVKRKSGNSGGYRMDSLSKYLVNTNLKDKESTKLVVVLDGPGVGITDAKVMMQKVGKLASTEVFAIGNKGFDGAQPFLTQEGSKLYQVTASEEKLVLETSQNDRTTVLGIEKMSIKQFLDNFDRIINYIKNPWLYGHDQYQTVGAIKNNDELKGIIMKEKSRLLFEYGKMNKGNVEVQLLECIKKSDFDGTIPVMQELVEKYYKSVNSKTEELSIEEKIDYLIKLCGGQEVNNFEMDGVRAGRAARAKTAENDNLDDVDDDTITDAQSQGIKELVECPLSGEQDVGLLLITKNSILDGIPKNIVNKVINCPMTLINFPSLKERIVGALGGLVGLKSFKESAMTESPLNGETVLGGILLSSNEKMQKVNKRAIAKMFTNGKLLGAPVYYLIAILQTIKELDEYQQVVLPLKQLILEMMKTSHTFASLSGMVSYVSTPLRTDVAFWFIVHSCLIKIPPANSPFILHLEEMQSIIDCLELLEYPIDERARKQYKRFVAIQVLHRMKYINSDTAHCFMRALYQKALFLDKSKIKAVVAQKEFYMPFVFVDGAADKAQVDHVLSLLNPIFKELTIEEILALDTLSHEKWRVNGTELPLDLPVVKCTPDTLWEGLKAGAYTLDVEKMKKKFVKKYGFEPVREEFLLFLSKRVKLQTLPEHIAETK